MNSNDYLEFETTLKDATTGYGGFILEDGKIKGYPVYINNALPDGKIIVGAFGELVVADFDGITIKVDDITGIKKQAVNVVCLAAFDGVVRKPGAFTVLNIAD
jgi:HK97 family phage major capsid protein